MEIRTTKEQEFLLFAHLYKHTQCVNFNKKYLFLDTHWTREMETAR